MDNHHDYWPPPPLPRPPSRHVQTWPVPPTTAATTRKTGPNDVVWANTKYIITVSVFFILLLLNNKLPKYDDQDDEWRPSSPWKQWARDRAGQGKSSRGRDTTCLEPLGMFLFSFFPIFYLLNFYLHLELPRWQRTVQQQPQNTSTHWSSNCPSTWPEVMPTAQGSAPNAQQGQCEHKASRLCGGGACLRWCQGRFCDKKHGSRDS